MKLSIITGLKKQFDKHFFLCMSVILISVSFALICMGGNLGQSLFDAGQEGERSESLLIANETLDTREYPLGLDKDEMWLWGSFHLSDYGYILNTFEDYVQQGSVTPGEMKRVICRSLLIWLMGILVISIVTAMFSNSFFKRYYRHLNGLISYSFEKDFYLIIGWGFQIPSLVERLLEESNSEILIITEKDCNVLNRQLSTLILEKKKRKRIYLQKSDYTRRGSYRKINLIGAQKVFIFGDEQNHVGDLTNLRIFELLKNVFPKKTGVRQLNCYLHFSDIVFFQKLRQEELLTAKERQFISLVIFNYYESWVWQCFSALGKLPHASEMMTYKPLAYRTNPTTKKVHLYIIGFGMMGQCIAKFATQIMNYGNNIHGLSRIIIFDPDPQAKIAFENAYTGLEFPEVSLAFHPISSLSLQAQEMMKASVADFEVSTTIMIALSEPNEAIRTYYLLSHDIRKENITVNIWQSTLSENVPSETELVDLKCSYCHVAFFGMLNYLPWYGDERRESAIDVMLAYDNITGSRQNWDALSYRIQYSNFACASTFKEKLYAMGYKMLDGENERCNVEVISDGLTLNACRGEHNRWITEKLIAGGSYNALRCDEYLWHPNLIPYDQLDKGSKAKDECLIKGILATLQRSKLNIAKIAHNKGYRLGCLGMRELYAVGGWGKSLQIDQSPLYHCVQHLKTLKQECLEKNQELVMYNQLAIGADEFFWCAARLAKVPIVALLPMPIDQYEKDFEDEVSLNYFRWRLRGCFDILIDSETTSRPDCYAASARSLVDKSDALWAIPPPERIVKTGGTYDTLHYATHCTQGKQIRRFTPEGKLAPFTN